MNDKSQGIGHLTGYDSLLRRCVSQSGAAMGMCTVVMVIVFAVLVSCANRRSEHISAKKLFTLPLGNVPGNFNPWIPKINTVDSFALHNGIFYIGNGNRLMTFSSSGVLLDYIAPAVDNSYKSGVLPESGKYNIPYYAYPLEYVGAIGVVSNSIVLVANTMLSQTLSSFELPQPVPAVQLLMYKNHEITKSIGKEGRQDFNFYSIEKIYTDSAGNVVVASREKNATVLYFFDAQEHFLRDVFFEDGVLPLFEGAPLISVDGQNTVDTRGVLVRMVPDMSSENIYVQARYYDFLLDGDDNTLQITYNSSRVFVVNSRTGEYKHAFSIPQVGELHSLQYVIGGKKLLFVGSGAVEDESSANNISAVVVSVQSGALAGREKFFVLEAPVSDFISYATAFDGKDTIGAYYVSDNEVSVVWWKLTGL